MSGVLTLTKPRTATTFARIDTDVFAVTIAAAAFVVLAVVTWGTWGDLGRDTGYDFVAATRVAHGQLPYVNFVYYYGPLAPFVLGLAAVIGGAGVNTFVAVGLALTLAIVGATYVLARTQTGPLGAMIAAVATSAIAFSPTNLSFVSPHTYSETFAILLALIFVLCLWSAADGRPWGALAAGIAAGLVALTRPEFEGAVVLAAVVWFAVRARSGLAVRRDLAAMAAPALLIPAVVYGAFLLAVSPHRLFLENLYPADTLHAGGSAILREQAPLTLHSFALVVAYLALYAVGAAVIVLASRALGGLRPALMIGIVLLVGAAILAVALADPEAARSKLQWVFGGVPAAAGLAAVALAAGPILRRRALATREQTLLAAVVILAVIAAKTYSGFFFLAERAQPAVYVAPFVFVALVRLHLVDLPRLADLPRPNRAAYIVGAAWVAVLAVVCVGLTVKDARAQSATVTGPGGTIHVSPAEAPLYRAALGAIASGTSSGDPILIAPQLSALYTLADRTDPLRQISLVPGALAKPGAELQAIHALAHVRLAIIDRHEFTEYGQTSFGKSFDQPLARWLKRNFNHAATLKPQGNVDHTLDVWVRKAST